VAASLRCHLSRFMEEHVLKTVILARDPARLVKFGRVDHF
jgi:hypothetical protein